jgi:hypothetical protein
MRPAPPHFDGPVCRMVSATVASIVVPRFGSAQIKERCSSRLFTNAGRSILARVIRLEMSTLQSYDNQTRLSCETVTIP